MTKLTVQAVSGCAAPQSLGPASTRPAGGRLAGYESVGGYARAAAKTGGKHLLGLGEAGFKYVSAQVGQWRSGSWEAASARHAVFPSLRCPSALDINSPRLPVLGTAVLLNCASFALNTSHRDPLKPS